MSDVWEFTMSYSISFVVSDVVDSEPTLRHIFLTKHEVYGARWRDEKRKAGIEN